MLAYLMDLVRSFGRNEQGVLAAQGPKWMRLAAFFTVATAESAAR